MIKKKYYRYLISPGPRPYFPDVAYHLWGKDCEFDSDGNDDSFIKNGWTELTLTLRSNDKLDKLSISVDPLDDKQPLILEIQSDKYELAHATGLYLESECGGILVDQNPRDVLNKITEIRQI